MTYKGLKSLVARVGGKTKLKKKIVNEYFPDGYESMLYVEPFVGGGSIFFYKQPSVREIINDKDTDIIQIFNGFKKYDGHQISNDINGDYDKELFKKILSAKPRIEYHKFIKELILYKTSFFGFKKQFGNTWYIHSKYGDEYMERLKHVQIYNTDYKNLIAKFDSPNTFFYLDPPYENSDRLYEHDTLSIDELFQILSKIKGRFLLSYNNSTRARELFKDYNIYKIQTKYTGSDEGGTTTGSHSRVKTELLICNY